MKHVEWLKEINGGLKTTDGKSIQVFEFLHQNNEKILSDWARYFRNHYCLDSDIDFLRKGYGYSRGKYLEEIKFPDALKAPGPSIRAGDFGEILVADYLQYNLNYWVPRTKYCDKAIRNESTKGCDIIGFKIIDNEKDSPGDTLAIFEAKTQFTGNKPHKRLQDAVQGSIKDMMRKAESLNAIKQRLLDKQQLQYIAWVDRFQNLEDRPHRELSGAVALFSQTCYDTNCISETDASIHPNNDNLILIVISGNDMMDLVHELYRRAADEA